MANAVFGVYSFSMSIISYAYEEGTEMYNLHYVITAVDMPIVLWVNSEYILIATKFSEMFALIVHKKPRSISWNCINNRNVLSK